MAKIGAWQAVVDATLAWQGLGLGKFLYYLTATFESVLSVVGIRAPYEQPAYRVVERLPAGVEIRAYPARTAVATPVENGDQGAAFGRLFRYIAGANHGGARIAMTVPVEQPRLIAMTIPVETGAAMRFFLPRRVAAAGAPVPDDPAVRVETVPAEQVAALRFSGVATEASREAHEAALRAALMQAGRQPAGMAALLSYDPPFALPFVRRNEVVLRLRN